MPHYDIGTLSLWIGVGVALIVGGIQAAGWRHRVLIIALIALGALCILAALAVPPLANQWPSIARFMTDAETPANWLCLFLLIAAYILISSRAKGVTADNEGMVVTPGYVANLLEAQDNSFKGTLGSVLHNIDVFAKRIGEVERRTTFPSNMGDTLREALESAERVRLSQIDRIRDEVERGSKKLNNAHLEAMHLLDFAINAATRTVCRDLIGGKPPLNKMNPPLDEKQRNEGISDMKTWLRKIHQTASVASHGVAIETGLQTAFQQATELVRQIPAAERPQGIDPLAFHDFFVPAHQSDFMVQCLEYVMRELDRCDRNSLDQLRHDFAVRSSQRT